jgi:serine phosphatase RsbU (regulator of sigma subunit)
LKKLIHTLLLTFLAAGLCAQVRIGFSPPADTSSHDIPLLENWKFHNGDDSTWREPGYNDSGWTVLKANKVTSLTEVPKKTFSGMGWFRYRFRISPDMVARPYALSVINTAAAVVYLNGKRLAGYGTIGHDLESESVQSTSGDASLVVFRDTSEQVLAIRYSNWHFAGIRNTFVGAITPLGISVSLKDWYSYNRSKLKGVGTSSTILGFLVGFFAALTVLHLLLYLYYRKVKSNLYYSVFSFCLALLFYIFIHKMQAALADQPPPAENVFMFMLLPILLISLARFLYSLFYTRLLWQFWVILGLGVLTFILKSVSMTISGYCSIAFILFTAVETIRIVIRAMNRKKDGAWIIGTGVLIAILFPLLVMLIAFVMLAKLSSGSTSSLEIFGMLIAIMLGASIISISLSMSIFLARASARTHRDLEAQLRHVQELSARTLEQEQEKKRILETQKEQLEVQVQERTAEVVRQKEEIEEKSEKLQQAYQDITDSILYAQRIQQAILPPMEQINAAFPDCFVLFKPKDIVSGDFYWFFERKDSVLIAAADCTGHGVPGAFMSALGSEKLDEAAEASGDVAEVLQLVNRFLKKVMHQSSSEHSTRDGMDIALVSRTVEHGKTFIEYAGANRPLWLIRRNAAELEEIRATKVAIGGLTEDDQVFDKHRLELHAGDTLYIFSDGYADQFSPQDKKLMTRRFKEILLEIQVKSMHEQKQYLNSFIEGWRGEAEQIDDILVIGIRV